MRLLRISIGQNRALLVVATMSCLLTIGKGNEAFEMSYVDNDQLLPIEESRNVDQQDPKDLNSWFSDPAPTAFITNALIVTKRQDKCNEDQIMVYLAEIQVINPETILQIASYKDLQSVCRKVGTTLESIDSRMVTCEPLPATNLYMRLTSGVRVLDNKLCTQSEYQLAFKKHIACYQDLHTEYIDCTGPADWIVDMEDQELCNQYKIIADCYYTRTALLCGIKAAKILKELVVEVIDAVTQMDCPEVRRNPFVADLINEHGVYGRKSSSSILRPYTLLLFLNFLIIFNVD